MHAPALRHLAITLLLAGVAACGGGANAATCESVAADGAAIVEELVNEIGDMQLADADQEHLADLQERFESRADNLEDRAMEACETEDEFLALVGEELAGVEAHGEVGELFLDAVRSEFGEV